MSDQPDTAFKIVAVGDATSRKLDFLSTYINREYKGTPSFFENQVVKIPNKNIVLNIWDTPESDRLRAIVYEKTDVVFLFFSFTKRTTFENLKSIYLPELKHLAPGVPVMLVGMHYEQSTDQELVRSLKLKNMPVVKLAEVEQLKQEYSEIFAFKKPELVKDDVDECVMTALDHVIGSQKGKWKGIEKIKEWFTRE